MLNRKQIQIGLMVVAMPGLAFAQEIRLTSFVFSELGAFLAVGLGLVLMSTLLLHRLKVEELKNAHRKIVDDLATERRLKEAQESAEKKKLEAEISSYSTKLADAKYSGPTCPDNFLIRRSS